ncbi:FixH family protein [Peribacillus simplex]|uniref:FixH family protein n=2 Tax=Peribacillus TaxID=2675229 RepID=A0AA90T4K3_9BACI|nr:MULTISPECIES: FixH family protein [Peribacillus]MDP1420117.1 FixH family protein [Peribacillus simplex]MDP1453793.1 FixH family protein [Peribacillus frigoritolerans]
MKKNICISLIFIFSLLLSACSLEQDVANLYKKEKPLESEIVIPESFSENKQETIKVVLTQDGKKVEGADYVHFEIWKQDGSLNYNMEKAEEDGNGTYSLSKEFDSEGLYYIKIHASNDGSIIMPQKQFIVGELSKSELEFLQKGLEKNDESSHEHHH